MKRFPITVCLTFDDGFKVHSTIAAPLLKKYGFPATFNIPTGFMDKANRMLTQEQIYDCRLMGNEDNLMDWDDVRQLIVDGFECFPHTLDHADLLALEQAGEVEELNRQVKEARREFIDHLGIEPRFFCSPHNHHSPLIKKIINANGMELFSCSRRNFPTHPEAEPEQITIRQYLCDMRKNGVLHIDIMIHGIDANRGGWEPFRDSSEFEAFLSMIKACQDEGWVKVCTYSSTHRSLVWYDCVAKLYDRIVSKIWRSLIRLNLVRL